MLNLPRWQVIAIIAITALAALFAFAVSSLLATGSMVHAAAATIRKEISARIFFINRTPWD